jgi:hypothetical protein
MQFECDLEWLAMKSKPEFDWRDIGERSK